MIELRKIEIAPLEDRSDTIFTIFDRNHSNVLEKCHSHVLLFL